MKEIKEEEFFDRFQYDLECTYLSHTTGRDLVDRAIKLLKMRYQELKR